MHRRGTEEHRAADHAVVHTESPRLVDVNCVAAGGVGRFVALEDRAHDAYVSVCNIDCTTASGVARVVRFVALEDRAHDAYVSVFNIECTSVAVRLVALEDRAHDAYVSVFHKECTSGVARCVALADRAHDAYVSVYNIERTSIRIGRELAEFFQADNTWNITLSST